METPEKMGENLINEISLPEDAKPGENPETYKKRIEREKEKKSKDTYNSKNQ
jgi:hypothetical protein